MKKTYKVKFDKKEREQKVNYYGVVDIHGFRKAYLNDYLKAYDEIVLSINTNLVDKNIDAVDLGRDVENELKETDYEYRVIPVPNTRDKKVLGVRVGTEKSKAFMILAKLPTQYLLETFYDKFMEDVDFMMGIEMDQSFDALTHDFVSGYEEYLYNVKGFKYVIYDSLIIKAVRTNFDYFPEVEF